MFSDVVIRVHGELTTAEPFSDFQRSLIFAGSHSTPELGIIGCDSSKGSRIFTMSFDGSESRETGYLRYPTTAVARIMCYRPVREDWLRFCE